MAAAQESVLLRAPFLDALVFLVRPCLEPRAQTVERVEERLQELVASRLGRVGRAAIGLRERDTVAFARCPDIACDLDDVARLARSEERRVGIECVRTCRSRWSRSD